MSRNPGHESLPPALERAAQILREDVVPRDAWRRQVMSAVTLVAGGSTVSNGNGSAHGHPPRRRSWSVRPLMALAAGLACAAIGSVATLAVVRARVADAPAASAVATSPTTPLVRFSVDAPTAGSVQLVGDFNGWDPAALPLRRSEDGRTWEVEIPLTPGRYNYSFLIDGALARDPRAARAADDDFGSPNSVVLVTGT